MQISKIDGKVDFEGGEPSRILILLLQRDHIATIEIKEAREVGDAVRIHFQLVVHFSKVRQFTIDAVIDTYFWHLINRKGMMTFDEYHDVLTELKEIATFE